MQLIVGCILWTQVGDFVNEQRSSKKGKTELRLKALTGEAVHKASAPRCCCSVSCVTRGFSSPCSWRNKLHLQGEGFTGIIPVWLLPLGLWRGHAHCPHGKELHHRCSAMAYR